MSPAASPALPDRRLFVLLWVCMGLHVTWLLAGAPPERWRAVLENFAYLPVFFLGAALAFGAGRDRRNPAAAAWRWMGAGLVSWGFAEVVYVVWDRALHLPTFPSPADAGWLLALAFLAAGLAHLRRKGSEPMFTLSFLVDAGLVTLIVADLLWTFTVRTTLSTYSGEPLPLGITLAYPAGDLLLCAVLVVLILWQPVDLARRELALLALGLFSFLTADVIYAYQQGHGTYHNGSLLDAGWSLAAGLIGWAAYQNHRAHAGLPSFTVKPSSLLSQWAPMLPHYGVLLAFVAYIVPHTRGPRLDPVGGALFLLILGLFVLRQFLILTHNRGLQLHLSHRAEHDPLTGVRNRADLEVRLQRHINGARRGGWSAAVLFIDLDRMKQVNDTFGHPAGDGVLREVAARLASLLGPGEELARFGGDEFVMVLPRVDPAGAAAAAARAVETVGQPFQVGPETVTLTASVGVALVPRDAQHAAQAIERADTAMYQAKHTSRNTWRFFDPPPGAAHAPQVQVEVHLRGALERGEFSVVFQPLVTLASGAAEGFEALLRWDSPVLGPVPPAAFIPVAEAREMMGGLGRWVLRGALEQARGWRAGPLPHAYVSVNVSATQFGAPDFVEDVRATLAEAALPASALMLELTESAVTADVAQAREKLLELRALGVRIALDDFGVGYSSLGHLRGLPADVLKIDRTFVREMGEDDAAFVRAIVTLGHSLGLRVVAEGIEDEAAARRLCQLGCDVGQGYLYARPLSVAEALVALGMGNPGRAQTPLPST